MEIILILTFFVGVAWISWRVAADNDISESLLALLFIAHLSAMQCFRWIFNERGDWIHYFRTGQELVQARSDFGYVYPGRHFIEGVSHLLYLIGPFSSLGMFIVFALCGFLGHLFFLAASRPYLNLPRDNVWLLLFFLPAIHMWTCSIGKDALIFLPLGYILYTVSRSRYPIIPLSGAAALVFMIRPHVMFFLITAAFLASVLSKGTESIYLKIAKVAATSVVLALTFPMVQNYVGLENPTVESATERIEDQALNNQRGDGAVELDRLSPPARLATYMFRPLFYDVRNMLGWAASLENALLLALFVLFVYQGIVPWIFSRPSFAVIFAVFFVLIMWFVNGMATANLGLAIRQKTQFLPYIFYVFLVYRWSREHRQVEILS